MAYTPPSSGSLSVEVSDGQAYTAPSASALNIELASSGGGSGVVSFVTSNGSLALTGYAPSKAVQGHTLPSISLSLTAYAPTYAKTRSNALTAAAALSLAGNPPAKLAANNVVGAGSLTLTPQQPTYFKGQTQNITAQGSLTLTAQNGMPATKATYRAPLGVISLTTPSITPKASNTLSGNGALTLTGYVPAKQAQKIRNAITGLCPMADITLDSYGTLTLAGVSDITANYRIRAEISASCGLMFRASAEVVGIYTARVANVTLGDYTIFGPVRMAVDSLYEVKARDRVVVGVTAPYRLPVAASFEAPYEIQSNAIIRNAISSSYSYTEFMRKAIEAGYSLTMQVASGKDARYSIEAVAKARAFISGIYSMVDAQVFSITQEPYVEYQNRRMRIEEAEITASEGSPAWTCSIVLTDLADYSLLRQDQPFTVVIGPERYSFIVDSKELDRSSPANYGMKLMGISPSAKFTTPRMLSFSRTWDTPTLASDIAKELLPGLDWRTVDWVVPAYRFAVQGTTAIEAVKTLAEAVGATLEADLDGSMFVRSLYPVSVPDYPTTTPAHIFLEEADILSVSESFVSSDFFNRVVITDTEQSIADSLEWIEDYSGATTGVVRAFLYPWRSGVTLSHTGRATVSLSAPEVHMEQHDEIIEVVQGEGSTQYPIHHVDSVEYEAAIVGSLVFDVDSRNFTVSGPAFNSVIRVVYWTRSLDYRASLPEAKPTQFLLESEPL